MVGVLASFVPAKGPQMAPWTLAGPIRAHAVAVVGNTSPPGP